MFPGFHLHPIHPCTFLSFIARLHPRSPFPSLSLSLMGKVQAAKRRRTGIVADKVLPKYSLPCENTSVLLIEAIPAHSMVAVGCFDGSIRIYTLANATSTLFRVFKKHSAPAVGIFSLSGDFMLSVDSTGMLISWNALTGKVIESFQSQNCSFGTVKKLNKRALLCSDANRDEIRIIQHSDGKDFKHLSTVKKVCGDSPIMNFAASQSVLVASSPLSNFIHVWDHDTLERKANFIQESTARGVLVNDEYIILGCDDGRIYIRKLRDMFSTASVIDLKPCAQYTDPILSMRIFFVSNDLVMAITRCIGFFLISIQDNKCVAHFQPDLSRNGSQSDPITATVLSDASVCYGGVGYCHIFNPPRRIQQLIDRSRRRIPNLPLLLEDMVMMNMRMVEVVKESKTKKDRRLEGIAMKEIRTTG